MDWVNRLTQALEDKGWSVAELARRSGVPEASLHKYLDGKVKQPRGNTFQLLALALEVDELWLKEGIEPNPSTSLVPIMGYVGAGSTVEPEYEQVPEIGLEQIEIPLALRRDLVAFEVRGDSMQPAFKPGMVIVTYREQHKDIKEFYGTEAVVRTMDGRRLVKTIFEGPSPKSVNLYSVNGGLTENVQIAWIGEIVAYFPSNQVRHLSRSEVA